jgi:hypothetical protein
VWHKVGCLLTIQRRLMNSHSICHKLACVDFNDLWLFDFCLPKLSSSKQLCVPAGAAPAAGLHYGEMLAASKECKQ